MRLRLEVTESPGRIRTVSVAQGQTIKVGRTDQADLSFPEDLKQSRLHFAIECRGETCRLRDLGSTNGTHLNGIRVGTSGPLQNGDEIRAGSTTFRVHVEAQAPDPQIPARTSPTETAIPIPPAVIDHRQTGHDMPTVLSESLADAPGDQSGEDAVSPKLSTVPIASGSEKTKPERIRSGTAKDSAHLVNAKALSPDQFVTAIMPWEDLDGTPRMTVIIKCTCSIAGGGDVAPVATEQLPIFTTDLPWDDDSLQTVRFESDMAHFKPRADVVLVGKAYFTRRKTPDGSLDVSLRVGSLQKTIRVFGDRTWWFPSRLTLLPEFSKPEPFVTMDLVYERAYGGIDESAGLYCHENLVGRGFIGGRSPDSIHGKRLPNLEDPAALIESWNSHPKPAGFGFYGRGWMPRLKLVGTPHAEPDPQERARGLPSDFNYAFFNGAHPDLQVQGYLKGNEEVELRNLSSDAFHEFQLPGIRPRVTVAKWTTPPAEWIDRQLAEGRKVSIEDVPTAEEPVRVALDTLVLIPDEKIFYLVFRGQCKLATLETFEVARVRVVMEKGDTNSGKG
jgi:hypothetical protein